MLDEQYNLVLQEHQVADLNEEQQGILEQGVQYLEDFYQALEENKTTDELFDILSQGLYDFSAYISSLYDYGTPSTRGQIRIILSIDFQKAFMNFIAGSVGALLGATGMFTTLVSMLVAATLPVAWIPVVGQAITIAVVALATFLAAYFWDKYVTSNMRFENMYWNVAKGLFVPNFDLWI
ncbi:MAG: hypothetical protein FWD76_03905 [Firmicutes bacterium]|nr:hypothetical protein [Bacillota bacterium]